MGSEDSHEDVMHVMPLRVLPGERGVPGLSAISERGPSGCSPCTHELVCGRLSPARALAAGWDSSADGECYSRG